MLPFEIYQAAHVWRNCTDARPWVIVDLRANGLVGCFPISSECYSGSCFEVSASHPDFAATGLTKSCFIHDSHIVDLHPDEFIRRRGALAGSLLEESRAFTGL